MKITPASQSIYRFINIVTIAALIVMGCDPPDRELSIKTESVTKVSYTSCSVNGSFLDFGEDVIVQHGFCYSLSPNPTVNDMTKKLGPVSSTDAFSADLTGLAVNTTYYVKAFAQNSAEPIYSEVQLTFKTLAIELPTVYTNDVSDISANSAIIGGNVTNDGGTAITETGVYYSNSPSSDATGTKLQIGNGTGSFSTSITSLIEDTSYYIKAYAINSVGTSYGTEKSFSTTILTDSRDGNIYNTVKIGTQWWMAENLKYLPSVVGPTTGLQTIPYYYIYSYDGSDVTTAKATANYTTYGVLYNWPAAMNSTVSSTDNPSGVQGVCPTGWHLPGDAEWIQLTDYLGGKSVAGGKLKETGTSHWDDLNTGATNETGFTALPGGGRDDVAPFSGIGKFGFWWSATESSTTNARIRFMGYNSSDVYSYVFKKEYGFSVRCVRD